MLVDAWLPRAAEAQPARPAVGRLSYEQLLARARGARAALSSRGVTHGERVVIALPAGEDFAVALHACMLLGAAAVPVDPRLTPAEAARMTAGAAVVVDAALETGGGPDPGPEQHDLDQAAIVVHTSGSSGEPKAVELSYGNWLWSALGSAAALGVDPNERWLCCLPLAHVGGLSILMRSAIYATTAVLHERFETERVLTALCDPSGPTLVSLVPTTLERLLDAGLSEPPALRWALLGGAPISKALLDRAAAAGVPVAPTYGMTEACSQVATFGLPLFCTRIRIAGDGELLVSGPTVAPAAGPTLHTGDLGSFDEHGRLTISGRKAETIISGGENVSPYEVEAVIAAHPAVADAAVHGEPDDEWGEVVVASVVLLGGASATADELAAWCAERLAPFKVPKRFRLVESLPRTASGKVARGELRG
jgi:O-succinylbenzoic acid--CoA ligase